LDQKKLDQQSQYWETNFSSNSEMFGLEPSIPAVKATKFFKEKNIKNIVELGAGLGRDTVYFAQNSIKVQALDYSKTAIENITNKAEKLNLTEFIKPKFFDVRKKLPFEYNSIEGCFSHMLYCMALSNSDLENLNNEICRILKPGGINIYTARHTDDGDYKNGIHRGENLYENDGYIVHFFSREKVNQLSKGFEVLDIEKFEEGKFPRKLFLVKNKKI
jgi:SAM-dependent methyltransferase